MDSDRPSLHASALSRRLHRRNFVRLAVASAGTLPLASLLAACGSKPAVKTPTSSAAVVKTPTTAIGGASTPTAAAGGASTPTTATGGASPTTVAARIGFHSVRSIVRSAGHNATSFAT